METSLTREARPLHRLETNGAALLRGWTEVELPRLSASAPASPPCGRSPGERAEEDASSDGTLVSARGRAPLWRPNLQDIVFSPETRSLLRHRDFMQLFEYLGGPLLILVGDALGDIVLETAVDGFTSGHPIIVVTDAAPPGLEKLDAVLASRAGALPLLSCFARLMSAGELMKEWIGSD